MDATEASVESVKSQSDALLVSWHSPTVSKIGTELSVNTQTLYDQTLAQTAKLNTGGFVTVWVDWAVDYDTTAADGSWSGIKAQVFSADGGKVGTEIQVNTATLNWQQDPHVAVLQNGNFVVTWTDGWEYFSWADHPGSQGVGGAAEDDNGNSIKAQVFSANGTPIGTEILVNTTICAKQTAEKIVSLSNGNFVVVWEDWSLSCEWEPGLDCSPKSCGGGPGIKAQIFDSIGTKVGSELVVTGNYNYTPQITMLANGGFVVSWHDGHYSVDDVRAQVYTATGVKVGSEILVNTNGSGATFSTQTEELVVGLSNGGFAVTWTDNDGDDSSKGVKARVFDETGAPVGSEILVNTATYSYQWHPQIAALTIGGFVVTWDNWSSGINVNAQIFDNSGGRIGSEILVNTTTGSSAGGRIATLEDGGFALTWWDSSGAWSGYGGTAKFQVFSSTGSKVGSETLARATAGGNGGAQITALDGTSFVVVWNDYESSGLAVKAQIFTVD